MGLIGVDIQKGRPYEKGAEMFKKDHTLYFAMWESEITG